MEWKAVLLIALYALAPPVLLWRYYRLSGHGRWWDFAMALNLCLNLCFVGLFALEEGPGIEPGDPLEDVAEWIGWAVIGATGLMATLLALKPWPIREAQRDRRETAFRRG